jgi:hypothetical protein
MCCDNGANEIDHGGYAFWLSFSSSHAARFGQPETSVSPVATDLRNAGRASSSQSSAYEDASNGSGAIRPVCQLLLRIVSMMITGEV